MAIFFGADRRWTGGARHAPLANLLVLIFTIAVFVISAILATQLRRASEGQVDMGKAWESVTNTSSKGLIDENIPGKVEIIFFEATTPLISILYGITMFFLHWFSKVGPITSLCTSVIFLTAWIVQLSIWTSCDFSEISNSHPLGFCYKWPAISADGTSPLQYTRFSFAMFCIFGHAALVALSAVAARRTQRDGYTDHGAGRKRGLSNDSSFRTSLSFDGEMRDEQ
ncbi:hypothetical protein GLAREA_04739 [Glarea lozoyensis ATCC 20868]|uniref:Uncharacterized protein n=1 Tax=Glarea lozoyensis (strain ATCC 20868 / MF5171) TaxID=1116229 RepID=S3DN90_GLAL2|nr:uncharacterized protein GLAREA_04739 [Glarea lozoyensis ATCC 20868]EPE27948.1 hypothetical protein GLAREA_04739 [Glarea lozoyensis ATCC 20868]